MPGLNSQNETILRTKIGSVHGTNSVVVVDVDVVVVVVVVLFSLFLSRIFAKDVIPRLFLEVVVSYSPEH